MNSSVFSFLSDFVFLLLLFIQIPSSLSNDDLLTACSNQFFSCGGISAGFPFWGAGRPSECGIPELELKCENDIAKMKINQVAYRVLKIYQYYPILWIAREDYSVGLCPSPFMNSKFNPKIFESVEGYRNFTLIYGCEDAYTTIPGPRTFTCKTNDGDGQSVYIQEGDNGPGECNGSVIMPVSIKDFPTVWNMPAVEEQLKKGFEVRWKVDMGLCPECFISSGVCGIDNVTNQTTCHCPDQTSGSKTCAPPAPTTIPAPTPIPAPGMHSAPEISL
ncbi:WALL-ASSOCIATED RECEPTOR KINASE GALACTURONAN-BINDING DOMAIN-CONTAINING PROTEIN-RELATED [Salix viminalis]|uniref:non-specific serine/threonine protein kinase n=1 Tax=Salix viminalis TaxID=40686 RepID=A0A9Q0P9X1_SALVM|nr:WALL-ASSOCIATED RECEPTOR KINASE GALACTURONAN-BINDING DOMAIN-CONTAINING PROTEIN-RELATED [Salix viminalis]